ncbi:hypothetical protein [Dysgonomonas sp. 216]|uniref:hypothetical protein n=1 Tax=Dysgonomonas sp. 216 TaxID=2302934 RepID=UPI0013D27082|nr:hypothetical protein [Dysgonomonas sp. 216]
MRMKELMQMQFADYQQQYNKLESDCIILMSQNKDWKHIAEKAAGVKRLIDYTTEQIEKL